MTSIWSCRYTLYSWRQLSTLKLAGLHLDFCQSKCHYFLIVLSLLVIVGLHAVAKQIVPCGNFE